MFQSPRLADARRDANDARGTTRVKLPPMYTLVRVKPEGAERYRWTGYIYDISSGGMRFELVAPVDPGIRLEVKAMLPGNLHTTIRAKGTVVRIHDDDNLPGPTRMGMMFDSFVEDDKTKLEDYLDAATTPVGRAA
jgi:c-di-GMP-binding flagellar brake protein YcgR